MLKRSVILSLIGFSIIFSAGVALIFNSSNKRDAEHIHLVSLAGEVEKEVLNLRIFIDDVILEEGETVIPEFIHSVESAGDRLEELFQILEGSSNGMQYSDLEAIKKNHEQLSRELERIDSTLTVSSRISRSDTTLFNALNSFILNFREVQTFLPNYLIRDNIRYRREIIIVLIINFGIILLAGFIILKLINRLILADRTMVLKTIEVENKERERIAADLHDGLGSMLSGLIIHLRVMEKQHKENPEIRQQLDHLNYMANEALTGIEEVIHNLNPSALARYGLIKSLEKYTEKVNLLGKTQFEVCAEGYDYSLKTATESMLYRICSELINNALKHSSASKATFHFRNQKRTIILEYQDDGVGFDHEKSLLKDDSSGLSNLIRRVDSLDGSYKLETRPGSGVQLKISFKAS